MDKIAFPYRSSSHLVLLHVDRRIRRLGEARARGRLRPADLLDRRASRRAHRRGRVRRRQPRLDLRPPRPRRQLGLSRPDRQSGATSSWWCAPIPASTASPICTAARSAPAATHPSLNDWLYLKQHGLDVDRDDVELVKADRSCRGRAADATPRTRRQKDRAPPLWQWVRDRKVDAALLRPPAQPVRQGRRPQGHRHRAAADDPVHHRLVEPAASWRSIPTSSSGSSRG